MSSLAKGSTTERPPFLVTWLLARYLPVPSVTNTMEAESRTLSW